MRKDRTAAERSRRYRQLRKQQAGVTVSPDSAVVTGTASRRHGIIPVIVAGAALAVAAVVRMTKR